MTLHNKKKGKKGCYRHFWFNPRALYTLRATEGISKLLEN